MPTVSNHTQPLNDATDHKLLPAIVKHILNDSGMELMRLPARFGGMAFDDPLVDSGRKHADSIYCTANLSQQIMNNGNDLRKSIDLYSKMKATVRQRHEAVLKTKADDLQRRLLEDLK